ncbi:MAG TPA: Uxx-star family glutaredoxin-like (seleno)protein [Candidatus Baltobacteraceae bacterium]|jgi:glutaredoxin 3|nr:Uxx-star family glutaredoxin-like (seleno)protein [Candidatus Baltobacteraceae bacterium]
MLELYGTAACPYTAQLRDDLQWRHEHFIEYDVENDPDALDRMLDLCDGDHTVPVLVEEGRVIQVGYEGRGRYAGIN